MKKTLILILTLCTLVLEILPYGAVCNFMTPPGEPPLRLTYSYFSLTPFGYANFAPFIVALLTCALVVLVIAYLFAGKRVRIPMLCVSTAAALLSLAPLLLGISYYSPVALCISLCLCAVTGLTLFSKEKNKE